MNSHANVPPQDIQAEQSVLGAILLDNQCLPEIAAILQPDDFYRDSHRLIYDAILELSRKHTNMDIITLPDQLRATGDLEKVGGVTYIVTLANLVPTTANATNYAKIVREKAVLRRFIGTATKMVQTAYNGDFEDVGSFISMAQGEISDIDCKLTKGGLVPVKNLVLDQLDAIERRKNEKGITGIPTGHPRLDLWTAGWQPGSLDVIAARPSMGKTSYAIQEGAYAAVKHGKKVAIFSLEMSKSQLVEKLLSNLGRVNGQGIRIGHLDDQEWGNLTNAAKKLYTSGLYIDDDPRVTVVDIKTRCRRMKQDVGLDMVIIDYLQLIKPHKRMDSVNREVGQITWELKAMAKEFGVPILLLSQLSRDCEKRPGKEKKPILSDLRDSGSIEQDADLVAFLYRDEYYNNDTEKKGITELIIAKQREGPTGTIELAFLKQFTKFEALER